MGLNEVIIVAVVILVLFGGKKIPELGKGIAGAIREFKKALRDEDLKDTTKKDDV